jgi:hypothetical protein
VGMVVVTGLAGSSARGEGRDIGTPPKGGDVPCPVSRPPEAADTGTVPGHVPFVPFVPEVDEGDDDEC